MCAKRTNELLLIKTRKMIQGIILMLMNYMSNLIAQGLPDNPSEKDLKYIKYAAQTLSVALDTFGVDLAEETTNPYDDKAVEEAQEACIEAAQKYGFALPTLT